MASIADLRDQALSLPIEDRASLARELILSLEREPFDIGVDQAWAAEVERRATAYAEGRTTARDWRESIARMKPAAFSAQIPNPKSQIPNL